MNVARTVVGRRTEPVQRRGIDKVEAILACARTALSDRDANLSIRQLATDTGMSVGSIYRYFDSFESVVEAALTEHAKLAEHEVGQLLAQAEPTDLSDLFTLVFDHFVTLYKENPKFTKARFSGDYAERYARIEEASNERLCGVLVAAAITSGLVPDQPLTSIRVLAHWNAIGAVLRTAFAHDPAQTDLYLDEARRMIDGVTHHYT